MFANPLRFFVFEISQIFIFLCIKYHSILSMEFCFISGNFGGPAFIWHDIYCDTLAIIRSDLFI